MLKFKCKVYISSYNIIILLLLFLGRGRGVFTTNYTVRSIKTVVELIDLVFNHTSASRIDEENKFTSNIYHIGGDGIYMWTAILIATEGK